MPDVPTLRDHAEAVALFRAQIIGALTRRDLDRGELAAAFRALAAARYRPPDRATTRQFGASTLERWFYAYRAGGLSALRPRPRSDRGRARELTAAQRDLLLEIRREHPTASAALILRTLVTDGRLQAGAVSAPTVARLYREAGLERGVRPDGHTRLRWQAEYPRRALAWRRLPRCRTTHRRHHPAAAHPRAPRRCLALPRGHRSPSRRARGRHAGDVPRRASPPWRARRALPR